MKTFKKYSTALKHANGKPIIRIGYKLYIVDLVSCDSIDFINPENVLRLVRKAYVETKGETAYYKSVVGGE